MCDIGGGIGENTIDELSYDLSVDYGVNLRGHTEHGEVGDTAGVLAGKR